MAAQAPAGGHSLSAAGPIWRTSLDEVKANAAGEMQDGTIVPPEELKKVAKWLQQLVTKFGAAAAVADSPTDKAVMAIGGEVMTAFTAVAQTLVCLSRGAGRCLIREITVVGDGLAGALEEAGAAVSTQNLAVCAGKVLDRVKHLERISAHNRASIRRKLLTSLGQARDAQRELAEALAEGKGGEGEEDEDLDDFGLGSEPEMDPEERGLVEAIIGAIDALLEVLKEASTSCVPGSASPTSGGGGSPAAHDVDALRALEDTAQFAYSAAQAVDGMAVHAIGGLELEAFKSSLSDMRKASEGLRGSADLLAALDKVQVALEAVPED